MATNVKRKKKAEVMSDDGSMTLTGHLKELRNRLIICAAVFVVGVIGFLTISDKLIDLLTAMAMNANYTFVFLAPQEKLMQYFRVSLIAAVIVTIPVALYQVYAFAKPGLKRSESFFFRLVLLFGLALFCVGVLFAYKVTLPFMLNFLVTLEGTDYITASISIESYINLCLTMFIIFGCVFEMPLVTIILAKMGIANPEIMKKGRGVAIVLIFLVAAIITPPDIVSQCFVAVPMCLLYFISIFLSGIFYKPKTDDDDEDKLIDLLTAMAMNANYTFVFLAPQEKLMQYFRVSLIAAVIVTIPVALYQVYAFAKPGLKRSESFFFRLVLLFGLALFCVGVLFAYKVTLPFMLNFLVTLEGTDYITASISIESYINLCLTMFIIFGCVFEMPLVTIILAKMGIANPEIMKKGRGVAIVLIFLVAAIITPPDIVSQCFVAVPMCLLYFISIFLSGIFYKPKTDDDDEDEDDEEESSDEE